MANSETWEILIVCCSQFGDPNTLPFLFGHVSWNWRQFSRTWRNSFHYVCHFQSVVIQWVHNFETLYMAFDKTWVWYTTGQSFAGSVAHLHMRVATWISQTRHKANRAPPLRAWLHLCCHKDQLRQSELWLEKRQSVVLNCALNVHWLPLLTHKTVWCQFVNEFSELESSSPNMGMNFREIQKKLVFGSALTKFQPDCEFRRQQPPPQIGRTIQKRQQPSLMDLPIARSHEDGFQARALEWAQPACDLLPKPGF